MSTFKLPESQKIYKRSVDKQLKQHNLPRIVWSLIDLLEEEMNLPSLAGELDLSETDTQMILNECLKRKLIKASVPEDLSYDDYFSCKEEVSEEAVSDESSFITQISEGSEEDFEFTLEDDDSDMSIVDIDLSLIHI